MGLNKWIDEGVNTIANMESGPVKSYLTGAWLPDKNKPKPKPKPKKKKKDPVAQQARTGLNKSRGIDMSKDRISGAEKAVFGPDYKRKNWGSYGR